MRSVTRGVIGCLLAGISTVPLASQPWGRVAVFGNGGNRQVGTYLDSDGPQILMGSGTGGPAVVPVYELVAGSWQLAGSLQPAVPGVEFFGLTVAIHGEWAAVRGEERGHDSIFLFRKQAGRWSYFQQIVRPAGGSSTYGYSIDLWGSTLLVSDYNIGYTTEPGVVHVYEFDGRGWILDRTLIPHGAAAGWRFGRTLAIEADRMVVTAPGAGAGRIYVYDRVGGDWRETGSVFIELPYHAGPVALCGDRFLVGVQGDPFSGRQGEAHLVEVRGGVWTVVQSFVDPLLDPGSYFGNQVALSEDRAAVSAPYGDADRRGDSGAGRAFLYRPSGSSWSLDRLLLPSPPRVAGNFGEGLSLVGSQLVASEGLYETVHVYDYIR